MLAAGALLSLYGVLQLLDRADHSFWVNGLFASRFVNSAHYAALAAASMPLAVGLALSSRRVAPRPAILLCAVISIGGVILAQSRAVWLIAIVICGALFLLLAIGATDMARPYRRWMWVGGLALLAITVAGAWFYRDTLADRISNVAATRGQSLTHRLEVWRVGWDMIKANPFGVGLGCFGEDFLRHKDASDRYVALRAHNELVQVTAELGWAGFAVLFACAVLFFRDIIRRWFPLERLPILVLCAAAGIDVFLWHSLVDFPLRLRANALFMAVLLGCMPTPPRAETPPDGSPAPRVRVAWVTGVLLVAVAAFSLMSAVSSQRLARANDHLRYARLDEAEPLLEQAMVWMPLDPEVLYELGGIDYARAVWAEPAEKRRLRERAGKRLKRSARLGGSRGMTHLRLAWVLADQGRGDEADARFQDAVACDPTLGCYHLYYADFLLKRDRHAEAVDRYGRALQAFHDGGVVDLRGILRKVYRATENVDDLRRLTPRDDHSQRVLAEFLQTREKP